MGLDPRLKEAIIRILNSRYPEWVHQEEIYQYVEENVELTDVQRELHVQKAGQIEENWQHDLRNLQHSLKRNGVAINPEREIWSLPIKDFDRTILNRYWIEAIKQTSKTFSGDVPLLTSPSGDVIQRGLFLERIQHLILSGGVLPEGRLHNWSKLEHAMIQISPQLTLNDGWVHITPFETEGRSGECSSRVAFIEKVSKANANGQAAVESRKKKGVERRTIGLTELRDRPDFERTSSSSIPYVIDRNGGQVTLQNPNLMYRKQGHERHGYVCPKCNFKTLVRSGPYIVDHFAHFPYVDVYLREKGITCPWYNASSGANTSGNNERSLQLLMGILSVRLRKGSRFEQPSFHTDGGASGLGFPIDTERPIQEVISFENFDEHETDRIIGVTERLDPPLKIRDLELESKIEFRRQRLQQTDVLTCPPLSEGDCFLIESTYTDEFHSTGRGLLRIRPGIDFLDNNKLLTGYKSREIGIVLKKNEKLPKGTILEFPLPVEGLQFVVFNCQDDSHVAFLDQYNVKIDTAESSLHLFEMLVHSPLHAHPLGKNSVKLERNESLALLVRNQLESDSETINQRCSIRRFTRRNPRSSRDFSRSIFEQPSSDPFLASGWGMNLISAEDISTHSRVLVDGSINWDEQYVKPTGGFDVYGGEERANLDLITYGLKIRLQTGETIEIDLMAADIRTSFESFDFPESIQFTNDLEQLATEEQSVIQTIVKTSDNNQIIRDWPISEICQGLKRLRDNGDDIVSFELKFNAEIDWLNYIGFPSIFWSFISNHKYQEQLKKLRKYLADKYDCSPPINLKSLVMLMIEEQGEVMKSYTEPHLSDKYHSMIDKMVERFEKDQKYYDTKWGGMDRDKLVPGLKKVYAVQVSNHESSKLRELELRILNQMLQLEYFLKSIDEHPGDISSHEIQEDYSGEEFVPLIIESARRIDDVLGKKMPSLLSDPRSQRKLFKGRRQKDKLNCLFYHSGLSQEMKEYLRNRLEWFNFKPLRGCKECEESHD